MKSIRSWPWGTIIIAVGGLALGGVAGYIVALRQYVGGTPIAATIAALTGLVGAIVAGSSIWFAHKSRTKTYAEMLHSSQLEAYKEASSALVDVASKMNAQLRRHSGKWNREAGEKLRAALEGHYSRFNDALFNSALLLPSKFVKALHQVNRLLSELLVCSTRVERKTSDELTIDMLKLCAEVTDTARTYLGVEQLSEEAKKLIGASRAG